MFLRLLLVLCLLSLSQSVFAQRSAKPMLHAPPENCPVTKPYQTSLFCSALPVSHEGTDRHVLVWR